MLLPPAKLLVALPLPTFLLWLGCALETPGCTFFHMTPSLACILPTDTTLVVPGLGAACWCRFCLETRLSFSFGQSAHSPVLNSSLLVTSGAISCMMSIEGSPSLCTTVLLLTTTPTAMLLPQAHQHRCCLHAHIGSVKAPSPNMPLISSGVNIQLTWMSRSAVLIASDSMSPASTGCAASQPKKH